MRTNGLEFVLVPFAERVEHQNTELTPVAAPKNRQATHLVQHHSCRGFPEHISKSVFFVRFARPGVPNARTFSLLPCRFRPQREERTGRAASIATHRTFALQHASANASAKSSPTRPDEDRESPPPLVLARSSVKCANSRISASASLHPAAISSSPRCAITC